MYITERIAAELKDPSHAALLTSEISRKYATGFHSSAGIVMVTKDKSYFIVDGRYFEKAEQQAKGCEVILLSDLRKQVYAIIEEHGIEVVSVESKTVTVSELEDYKQLFNALTVDSSSWLSSTLERMRIIKSEEEIEKIEAAQRIAEAAFSKLITSIRVGMTEKQVAAVLEFYMKDLGADGISFDTIAASGVNSACPHAVPTDKPLQNGEFLTLDFGATVDGYHSDMTRTVVIGKPDEEMKNIYNAVWGAQTDAIKAEEQLLEAQKNLLKQERDFNDQLAAWEQEDAQKLRNLFFAYTAESRKLNDAINGVLTTKADIASLKAGIVDAEAEAAEEIADLEDYIVFINAVGIAFKLNSVKLEELLILLYKCVFRLSHNIYKRIVIF